MPSRVRIPFVYSCLASEYTNSILSIMKLLIEPSALKTLQGMQPKAQQALVARLEAVAADPFAKHSNVERMKGEPDTFRLRRGEWRAIYWIDRIAQQMTVVRVAPRKEVYR